MVAWAVLLAAAPVAAAPVGVGGGVDYSSGPGDQTTRSVTGLVSLNAGPRLTLGAMRYDDNVAGAGSAGLAVADVALAPLTRVQIAGARFVGDGAFRAWRLKAGPEFTLPGGPNLGVYYVHVEQQGGIRSDGATGELALPMSDRVVARVGGSWATITGSPQMAQGTLGLTYSPDSRVAVSGDVGLGRNGSVTTSTVPTAGPRAGIPIVGGLGSGGGSSAESRMSSVTQSMAHLSVRFMFP